MAQFTEADRDRMAAALAMSDLASNVPTTTKQKPDLPPNKDIHLPAGPFCSTSYVINISSADPQLLTSLAKRRIGSDSSDMSTESDAHSVCSSSGYSSKGSESSDLDSPVSERPSASLPPKKRRLARQRSDSQIEEKLEPIPKKLRILSDSLNHIPSPSVKCKKNLSLPLHTICDRLLQEKTANDLPTGGVADHGHNVYTEQSSPQLTNTVPSSCNSVPTSCNTVPSSCHRIPTSCNKVPSSCNNVPSSCNTIPSSCSNVPSGHSIKPSSCIVVHSGRSSPVLTNYTQVLSSCSSQTRSQSPVHPSTVHMSSGSVIRSGYNFVASHPSTLPPLRKVAAGCSTVPSSQCTVPFSHKSVTSSHRTVSPSHHVPFSQITMPVTACRVAPGCRTVPSSYHGIHPVVTSSVTYSGSSASHSPLNISESNHAAVHMNVQTFTKASPDLKRHSEYLPVVPSGVKRHRSQSVEQTGDSGIQTSESKPSSQVVVNNTITEQPHHNDGKVTSSTSKAPVQTNTSGRVQPNDNSEALDLRINNSSNERPTSRSSSCSPGKDDEADRSGSRPNSQPNTPASAVPGSPLPINPHHNLQLLQECQMAVRADDEGDLPLHIATVQGAVGVILKVIPLMSIANVPIDSSNNLQQTALHLSVITKQPHITRLLLKYAANPGVLNRHGNSSLHLAILHDSVECLHVLLEGPKKPNLQTKNFEGLTALHLSVFHNKLEMAATLLDAGAEVDFVEGKSGRTSLHLAAETGHIDLVELLLTRGAGVNVQSYSGSTALHLASGRGLQDIVGMLLKYGADSTLRNVYLDQAFGIGGNTSQAGTKGGAAKKSRGVIKPIIIAPLSEKAAGKVPSPTSAVQGKRKLAASHR